MRVPRLSSGGFRRLTTVNLVLLVAIVVSGAVVRLTNSGLGCRDWPNCSSTQFVSVSTHHALIEQVNRIFSGAIGIPLVLTLVAAYGFRPRRADLVRLAWILFGLFWCEAILGGISVEVKLAWVSVMSHFLLALALVSGRVAPAPSAPPTETAPDLRSCRRVRCGQSASCTCGRSASSSRAPS